MARAERNSVVAAFRDDAPPAQAKGAFLGSFAGIAGGAVLGVIVGFLWIALSHSTVPNATRLILAIVAFAIGGAVAGFVAGGALNPRVESHVSGPSEG